MIKFYAGLHVTDFPVKDLHVTTMFSDLVPTSRLYGGIESGLAKVIDVQYWKEPDITVLKLKAPIAVRHYNDYTELGFIYDHEYIPHATLCKGNQKNKYLGLIGEVMTLSDPYVRLFEVK
jgi:hypothetical protein